MTDPSEQQRAAIRNACVNLRRLLASVRPPDMPVRRIESGALIASLDECTAIRKRFEWLISQFQKNDAGDAEKIIMHSRWKQFFGAYSELSTALSAGQVEQREMNTVPKSASRAPVSTNAG